MGVCGVCWWVAAVGGCGGGVRTPAQSNAASRARGRTAATPLPPKLWSSFCAAAVQAQDRTLVAQKMREHVHSAGEYCCCTACTGVLHVLLLHCWCCGV